MKVGGRFCIYVHQDYIHMTFVSSSLWGITSRKFELMRVWMLLKISFNLVLVLKHKFLVIVFLFTNYAANPGG
jgi:hypothetical protein